MPATAKRRLFVNWYTKLLQVSDRSGAPIALPAFNKYETIAFEIVIVQPDLSAVGLDKWSRVDISNLSLSVAINDTLDDAAPLAQQTVWSKDETENVFSAELALNTAPFNAWFGSSTDPKSAYFEIEFQEGTQRSKIYVAPVIVANAVTQPTTTAPTPIDEYLTKAQTDQQFIKKVMGAGETITLTTPDGLNQRVLGAANGQVPIDQWFTV